MSWEIFGVRLPRPDLPISERARARLRWAIPTMFALLAAIFLSVGFGFDVTGLQVVGFVLVVVGMYFTLDALGLTEDPVLAPREPAESRVQQLVGALNESTKVIAEIENEVKARSALAQRLQQDIQRHEELLKLNRAEVEAVAQTFRTEVRREGRGGLVIQFVMNAFFFGLGVVVTLLVT